MAPSTYLDLKIDVSKLERFADQLAREIDAVDTSGPMHGSVLAAAAVYMGWTRERFDRFSRGGGDWAPLAESTKRARRNKNKDRISILVDTAILKNSVSSYKSEPLPSGVRVGSDVTYGLYHQEGTPKMPKRSIFIDPPADILQRIEGVLEQGFQRSVNKHGGSPTNGATKA